MERMIARPGPRRLRFRGVGLPLALIIALLVLGAWMLRPWLGAARAADLTGLITVLRIVAFTAVSWRLAERAEAEMVAAVHAAHGHERQLVALHEAALSVTSALDLPTVLRRVVEASRTVIDTAYGALAVLGADGSIEEFIPSGMDEETIRGLGAPPTGHGLLGLVIAEQQTLRVDEISAHAASVGFPPAHPPMHRLLAVPLFFQGAVFGSLYLADRVDGRPFDAEDQQTLERFGAQAAIAVGNARLYGQLRRLSLVEERERISMDLHDGVLQTLYAIGLGLESALEDVERDPAAARQSMDGAIGRLHGTIADIRHYIFDLRASQQEAPGGLATALRQLLDGLQHPGVELTLDAAALPVEPSKRVQWECWHVAREAISNALRHAHCGRVAVSLGAAQGELRLGISDDGAGFAAEPSAPTHGGLRNMRRRAEAIGGRLAVETAPGRGTVVSLLVPLDPGEGTV